MSPRKRGRGRDDPARSQGPAGRAYWERPERSSGRSAPRCRGGGLRAHRPASASDRTPVRSAAPGRSSPGARRGAFTILRSLEPAPIRLLLPFTAFVAAGTRRPVAIIAPSDGQAPSGTKRAWWRASVSVQVGAGFRGAPGGRDGSRYGIDSGVRAEHGQRCDGSSVAGTLPAPQRTRRIRDACSPFLLESAGPDFMPWMRSRTQAGVAGTTLSGPPRPAFADPRPAGTTRIARDATSSRQSCQEIRPHEARARKRGARKPARGRESTRHERFSVILHRTSRNRR